MNINLTQHEKDLREFFGFILDKSAKSKDLIKSYIEYHGLLNFGHKELFYKTVKSQLVQEGFDEASQLQHHDILGPDGEVLRKFLLQYAPDYPNSYYDRSESSEITIRNVFPASENTWCCDVLPPPYATRLTQKNRPSFDIYYTPGQYLFVSTYGYQHFNLTGKTYSPLASSRAFSISIEEYPLVTIDQPVVIIQDQFDSSNFSHFLYDYIPQIIYFQSIFPDIADKCIYLLGGVEGRYQQLFIDLVVRRYNLNPKQFVWMNRREIWKLMKTVYFFSDQRLNISHPLQMCHPRTLRLVTGLIDLLPLDRALPNKIYISRADAEMRRIRNESEIIESLEREGFTTVTLSKMSILEQISMLAGAALIAGPHGMGFTNMLFNKELSRIVEVFSPDIGSDAYAFVARSTGMEYRASFGRNSLPADRMSYEADVDRLRELVS